VQCVSGGSAGYLSHNHQVVRSHCFFSGLGGGLVVVLVLGVCLFVFLISLLKFTGEIKSEVLLRSSNMEVS